MEKDNNKDNNNEKEKTIRSEFVGKEIQDEEKKLNFAGNFKWTKRILLAAALLLAGRQLGEKFGCFGPNNEFKQEQAIGKEEVPPPPKGIERIHRGRSVERAEMDESDFELLRKHLQFPENVRKDIQVEKVTAPESYGAKIDFYIVRNKKDGRVTNQLRVFRDKENDVVGTRLSSFGYDKANRFIGSSASVGGNIEQMTAVRYDDKEGGTLVEYHDIKKGKVSSRRLNSEAGQTVEDETGDVSLKYGRDNITAVGKGQW